MIYSHYPKVPSARRGPRSPERSDEGEGGADGGGVPEDGRIGRYATRASVPKPPDGCAHRILMPVHENKLSCSPISIS